MTSSAMGSRRTVAAVAVAAATLLLAPAGAHAKVVWLCKPGMKANPCEPRLTTTNFGAERSQVERVRRARRRRADCFYLYPTVSNQSRPQATEVVDDVLRSVALYQAARYSRDCRVFAPVYRQVTIQGLSAPQSVTRRMREQGYADVVEAWRTYLRRFNKGRGVVFVSHSQGTFVLRRMIRELIDPRPRARRRIVSALLLGGNVTVREGGDRGGDFRRLRACRARDQVGCIVAFSSFNEAPPAGARFGVSTDPGLEILCTNPGALAGGRSRITPIYPTKRFAESVIGTAVNLATSGLPQPRTPWAAFPDGYVGRCARSGEANVLRVRPRTDLFDLNAVPDATWGTHLADANIALGELTDLVRHQIRVFNRR
jgi:hypothetical protein